MSLALLSKQFYIVLLTAVLISSSSDLQESKTGSTELKTNVVKLTVKHLQMSLLKGIREKVQAKTKTLGQRKINSFFEDIEFSQYREM